MLDIQAAAQLGVLDHRPVEPRLQQTVSALPRETVLVTLVEPLGVALEADVRRRHRQLHERGLAAGLQRAQQAVHERLPLVLEAVDRLDPLDEQLLLL